MAMSSSAASSPSRRWHFRMTGKAAIQRQSSARSAASAPLADGTQVSPCRTTSRERFTSVPQFFRASSHRP